MGKTALIRLIANYFKTQPVIKAWLFGSYARGEETEKSDVDIIVSLDYSRRIGLKFFKNGFRIRETNRSSSRFGGRRTTFAICKKNCRKR